MKEEPEHEQTPVSASEETSVKERALEKRERAEDSIVLDTGRLPCVTVCSL